MSESKSLLVSAAIIALAILLAPILWQHYKMRQCVGAFERAGLSRSSDGGNEFNCLQVINGK